MEAAAVTMGLRCAALTLGCWLLCALGLLPGCGFDPTLKPGFPCGPDYSCPHGLSCQAGVCCQGRDCPSDAAVSWEGADASIFASRARDSGSDPAGFHAAAGPDAQPGVSESDAGFRGDAPARDVPPAGRDAPAAVAPSGAAVAPPDAAVTPPDTAVPALDTAAAPDAALDRPLAMDRPASADRAPCIPDECKSVPGTFCSGNLLNSCAPDPEGCVVIAAQESCPRGCRGQPPNATCAP